MTVMKAPAHTEGTYPFVTILVDDPPRRARALQRLQKAGLGAARLYVCAIPEYEYLAPSLADTPCPNGRYLADRVLTLSTTTYLTKEDIQAITAILRES